MTTTVPASIVSSTYPISIDTNENLFNVNDNLRVKLIEDYNPGDTSITVLGDSATMALFDATGIITLTDQCNAPENRAISFYYGSHTSTTFDQLQLLPGYEDVSKPKNFTDVTQNVMAEHHNNLINSIIAIEQFAGKKGELPLQPLQGTMEQRITYVRNIALQPKAWFSADETIGLAPFTVNFKNQSFRLGTDGSSHEVTYTWDFGDGSPPTTITAVDDTISGDVTKIYTAPGVYDVTLTVTNDFGTDQVIFPEMINARYFAPDTAVINFVQRAGQIVTAGSPDGGPYTTTPIIRSGINQIIDATLDISQCFPPFVTPSNKCINPNTGLTNGGEYLDGSNNEIDPIAHYTWVIADDLTHSNAPNTRSIFSIGGLYDLILRVDTQFGSYRITEYHNAFDIVESLNLWLWTFDTTTTVAAYEFGLISETFKSQGLNSLNLQRDDSFLTGAVNEGQQKVEFHKNCGFTQLTSSSSGAGGTGLLYWASGRTAIQSASHEKILMSEFNGFTGIYVSKPNINRPWNWIGLNSSTSLYFLLGGVTSAIAPYTSPTNQTKTTIQLSDPGLTPTNTTLGISNYINGANELTNNEVAYDLSGNSLQGNMSVYRSTWHSGSGYILRNQSTGNFFRIKSFYKTTGNLSEPFQSITKLIDMGGSAKVEGELVSLSLGVYFFTNSGTVTAYNDITSLWQTGGPGLASNAFRNLQDTSVIGFDSASQTMLAVSDNDKVAYLSFDYSSKAFMKFNETDTTFSAISARPSGSQWQMSIF